MFGYTITKKSDLEAQAIKLSNAEAKAEANSKKFKTATITGSATTGAAVAAIAAHFLLGNGRKVNRNKIKNFDSVVEERDAAVTARVAADAKVTSLEADKKNLETEKKGLESTCELLAGSAYNVQAAAVIATSGIIKGNATFQRACYDHDLLVKKAFNPKDDEEFMKLRQGLFKSFTESIKELEKLDVAEETETEEETEEKVQQPQNPVPQQKNDPVPQQKNDQLADAQAKRNAACKKAGDAKTALENVQKNLNAAKTTDPTGDHSALEKAVAEAQAAFDAANQELVDADAALKDIQANQTQK